MLEQMIFQWPSEVADDGSDCVPLKVSLGDRYDYYEPWKFSCSSNVFPCGYDSKRADSNILKWQCLNWTKEYSDLKVAVSASSGLATSEGTKGFLVP